MVPPRDADAVQGSLDDRVLLRVQGPHAMAADHQMADFVAMRQAGGRAVVASRQDAPIFER
jgi:hypothetical protein